MPRSPLSLPRLQPPPRASSPSACRVRLLDDRHILVRPPRWTGAVAAQPGAPELRGDPCSIPRDVRPVRRASGGREGHGLLSCAVRVDARADPDTLSWQVVLLVVSSVGASLAVPPLVPRGYSFGYYLAWTFFAAMGVTELAHFIFSGVRRRALLPRAGERGGSRSCGLVGDEPAFARGSRRPLSRTTKNPTIAPRTSPEAALRLGVCGMAQDASPFLNRRRLHARIRYSVPNERGATRASGESRCLRALPDGSALEERTHTFCATRSSAEHRPLSASPRSFNPSP